MLQDNVAWSASNTEGTSQHSPFVRDELWQSTVDGLSAHIALLDAEGVIVAVNRAWREFSQREGTGQDWIGSNYLAACESGSGPEGLEVSQVLREMLTGRRGQFEREYPCHAPLERRWFLLRAWPHRTALGLGVVVAHEPLTQLRLLEEQAARHAALLDQVDAAVVVTDQSLIISDWNRGAETLYGYTRDEAIGSRLVELILAPAEEPVECGAPTQHPVRERRRVRRKDGTTFTAHARIRPFNPPCGSRQYVCVSLDLTDLETTERALVGSQNYLSALTASMGDGLYTLDPHGRIIYMNHAAEVMLGWSLLELQTKPAHTVIHSAAAAGKDHEEECPIAQATRQRRVVRVEEDTFFRADGRALQVRYTASPFETEDGTYGCAVVFQDITERRAREARTQRDLERLTWLSRIQDALRTDGFVLHAQPIVDLGTGAIVQRELLLRMRYSLTDGGTEVSAPGNFLPVAEEYGLIAEIDRWVVDQAARLAAAGTAVELNVSALSVVDPSFPDHVWSALQRAEADPHLLVFEITETALITDEMAARRFVERLHSFGCGVALDDFGTGYGGFTYLKHLPIDMLKIDMEFVRDLTRNAASRNVVEAVTALARSFGLKTVAEGVEDAETADLLSQFGVDYAQGFHFGRPGPLTSNGNE